MKRFVAVVLLVCMVFALTACGKTEYKLGMGVSVSTDSSASGNAQVDATVAAVVTDASGKIAACRIDCAQSKMDITAGTADTAKTFLSKVELGDDYNMVKYSNATHEWYEQAAAFEQYCVGKTAADISGMDLRVNEEGYNVTTDETLFASCSISIDAFIDAVVKACNDSGAATFTGKDFKLGVACITKSDESTDATADENGVVKMYTEFGATAVGADGKILAAVTDAIQPQIGYDQAGEIGDITFKGTKRELGPDYNMVKFGNAIAEWDAQAQAFANYCVGKTSAEVRGLETVVNEEGNQVTTDETLFASCTMSIGGMMAVLAQAADYAK